MGRDTQNFLLAASAVIAILYIGKKLSTPETQKPVVQGWFG